MSVGKCLLLVTPCKMRWLANSAACTPLCPSNTCSSDEGGRHRATCLNTKAGTAANTSRKLWRQESKRAPQQHAACDPAAVQVPTRNVAAWSMSRACMQALIIKQQHQEAAQHVVACTGSGCAAYSTAIRTPTASSADTRGSCDPAGMLASFSAITCESSMLARLPLSAAKPHRSTLTSRGLADAEPDVEAPAVQCTCTGAAGHLSLLAQTEPFDVLSENGLQSSSCSPSCAKLTRRKGFRQTLLVPNIEGN
jgi:hypothetical protein